MVRFPCRRFLFKRMRYNAPRLDVESVWLERSCTGAATMRMARVSCFGFLGGNPTGLSYLYVILGPKRAPQSLYL
jgi:hypothetical protein